MEHLKNIFDLASFSVLVATLSKILPGVAALLTIIWTCIRIYDWLAHRKVDD